MKVVKIILGVLLLIVGLFLLVAVFLPADYRVERNVVIDKPVDVVYSYTADYTHRGEWDPWMEMEPEAQSTFEVIEGYVGSSWAWEGEELGSGKMTIELVVENESIRSHLAFISPQPMESEVTWDFKPTDTGAHVLWGVEGSLAYPLERYFGLMMDEMMGADLERGLGNLKRIVESMAPDSSEE